MKKFLVLTYIWIYFACNRYQELTIWQIFPSYYFKKLLVEVIPATGFMWLDPMNIQGKKHILSDQGMSANLIKKSSKPALVVHNAI